MKIKYFIAILGMFLAGCAIALQELRSYPSFRNEIIKKDSACVFNKLNSSALKKDIYFPFTSKGVWQSAWDPTIKYGEIYYVIPDPGTHWILFTVKDNNNNVIIETRIVGPRDPRPYPVMMRRITDEILQETDYSQCANHSSLQ
jgi:hypothetical protein